MCTAADLIANVESCGVVWWFWSGLLVELLMNRGDAEVSFLSNGIFHQRVLARRDGRRARQASRGVTERTR